MLNYQSENFKSLEELRETAPSIFTKRVVTILQISILIFQRIP
jgi:hypothetical protein